MPNGLDQSLTDEELADLVRFLSELGKPGPFGVTHVPVARRWQKLNATPAEWKGRDAETLGKTLHDGAGLVWSPVYARVSGDLPLKEALTGEKPVVVFRTQLEVVTAGKVALAFSKIPTIKLWVNGKPAPVSERTTLDLDRGIHTLTIWIERSEPTMDALRVELGEIVGSKAAARFVSGR